MGEPRINRRDFIITSAIGGWGVILTDKFPNIPTANNDIQQPTPLIVTNLTNPESTSFRQFAYESLVNYYTIIDIPEAENVAKYAYSRYSFCPTTEVYFDKIGGNRENIGNWGHTTSDNKVFINLEKINKLAQETGNLNIALAYIIMHEAGHLFVQPRYESGEIHNGGRIVQNNVYKNRLFNEAWVETIARFTLLNTLPNNVRQLSTTYSLFNRCKYNEATIMFTRLIQETNLSLYQLYLLHQQSRLNSITTIIGKLFATEIQETSAFITMNNVLQKKQPNKTINPEFVIGKLMIQLINNNGQSNFNDLMKFLK